MKKLLAQILFTALLFSSFTVKAEIKIIADTTETFSGEQKAREVLVNQVVEVIGILCSLWRLCVHTDTVLVSADERIKYRIRKLMEAFIRIFPQDTVEALVDCWLNANPQVSDPTVSAIVVSPKDRNLVLRLILL